MDNEAISLSSAVMAICLSFVAVMILFRCTDPKVVKALQESNAHIECIKETKKGGKNEGKSR